MSIRSVTLSAAVAASALAFAGASALTPAGAQSSPFTALSGSWAGTGTITLADGSTERIRCRATYNVPIETNLTMSIRCASDSYRFDLSSSVVYKGGGAISGTWSEASRNIGGSIEGRAQGGHITARADTGGFSAVLNVTTQAKRQSVGIRAGSGNDMTNVSITMSRS